MDTTRLEKQMRNITLICAGGLLIIRLFFKETDNPIVTYLIIALLLTIIVTFIYRLYLEKKNGTFVAKRYYLVFFFLIVSTLIFLYSFLQTVV